MKRIDSLMSYIDFALNPISSRYPQPSEPILPIAKVRLPWLDSPIDMKVLCFYEPDPHLFGCQYCNLFYSPVTLNTRHILPTIDKSIVTLFNYEQDNADKDAFFVDFASTEHAYQAAKAEYKIDALFVASLSSEDSCAAGQARLKMNDKLANQYKSFGGTPYKIDENQWMFGKNEKRFEMRKNWHDYKVQVMNYAIRQKFNQNYQLIKQHVDSKTPIYFVEHTPNDTIWADHEDGYGKNYLGKLLTTLCWEFRQRKDETVNITKYTIDTMSEKFRMWMEQNNIEVIQNGEQFYKDLETPWL
eukprot:327735_1